MQTVRALHPPLGQNHDHRIRVDLVQHFEPRVIALACDRDDMMRDELEDHPDERPARRLVRRRNHAVRRETP